MDFEYKLTLIAKDAKEEGRREARLSNYSSLVQDGILSLSEAMKRSGLSEEEIKGWIQAHPNT